MLRMALVGANREAPARGADLLEGKVNYLMGSDPSQWRTDIPTYKRVRYSQVYPGIDLVYYGTSNPGPWNPDQRPGDNKWTTTLFARDPDTGEAVWAYQLGPPTTSTITTA